MRKMTGTYTLSESFRKGSILKIDLQSKPMPPDRCIQFVISLFCSVNSYNIKNTLQEK